MAAWMSAETGVGPAMASGSHTNSGIWADLPAAPMKSSTGDGGGGDRGHADRAATGERRRSSSEPIVAKARNMASMKPQSPIRLVTNAFLPAVALASSVNQNEMRKYEQAPTPSQPRKVSSRLSPSTSISIEKTNRFR